MVKSSRENQVKVRVQYSKKSNGQRVLVRLAPCQQAILAFWRQVTIALQGPASGLAWIDEHEPKAQLLADLQVSLKEAAAGQTFPVSQLWDDLDDE